MYLEIWRMLIERGADHAATGLLFDAFAKLEGASLSLEHSSVKMLSDGRHAQLREELMEIIEDPDGRTLREWQHTFSDDEMKFHERAAAWVYQVMGR